MNGGELGESEESDESEESEESREEGKDWVWPDRCFIARLSGKTNRKREIEINFETLTILSEMNCLLIIDSFILIFIESSAFHSSFWALSNFILY